MRAPLKVKGNSKPTGVEANKCFVFAIFLKWSLVLCDVPLCAYFAWFQKDSRLESKSFDRHSKLWFCIDRFMFSCRSVQNPSVRQLIFRHLEDFIHHHALFAREFLWPEWYSIFFNVFCCLLLPFPLIRNALYPRKPVKSGPPHLFLLSYLSIHGFVEARMSQPPFFYQSLHGQLKSPPSLPQRLHF